MTKQKKLKEIIFSEFDKSIEGIDIYDHLGSKWIIFTNERRWVLEFTNDRTLWFNYRHFDDILALFAMDSDQYSDYIKEWYERRFIFKSKVENTIQNGVKSTVTVTNFNNIYVENTIQNGVKSTDPSLNDHFIFVENTIQNGVKSTNVWEGKSLAEVENTIQNGVEHCEYGDYEDGDERIEKICQNRNKSYDLSIY